jgi:hypothetical protein
VNHTHAHAHTHTHTHTHTLSLSFSSSLSLFVTHAVGLFGMIGWAVWFSFVQNTDISAPLTITKIGYSQALVITAWTSSIVGGAAGAALGGGAN